MAQHVATGYMGNFQECEEVWREWNNVLCAKCVELKEERQAVAARVRAVWMKFRELGGILCMQGASLRMKGVVYKACVRSVLIYDIWGKDLGDESRGFSEAASNREENA